MRFLSLFSGIEAASVAARGLGWKCVAVSEVDPFCCRLLKHHYPGVPNLGDVTKITERQIIELGAIDVVIFGSPCQDLSVAGKRGGLAGERSGLFYEAIRIVRWSRAPYALFENVPGLFSSNAGRDFASVAGEMAGMECDVPAGGWQNTGVCLGRDALVEWAVLDAQWFGVPQRRRRIFALRRTGGWANTGPILFERDSLSGHPPPRRETGKDVAGSLGGGSGSRGWRNDLDRSGAFVPEVSMCLNAGGNNRIDGESETFVPEVCPTLRSGGNVTGGHRPPGTDVDTCDSLVVTHSLRGEGFDASEDGTGRGTPLVPCIPILEAGARTGTSTTDPRAGIGVGDTGDPMYTLQSGKQHAVAVPAFSLAIRGRDGVPQIEMGDEVANAILTPNGGRGGIGVGATLQGMQVRRLLPVECEKLQGFPPGYTAIPGAKDGPRYKALGNSMAVPVIRWMFERIDQDARINPTGAKPESWLVLLGWVDQVKEEVMESGEGDKCK